MGTSVNLNIYPSINFLSTTQVQIVFQTAYDSVRLNFYSMVVVFWISGTITANGYSSFNATFKDSSTTLSNLIYTTPTLDIYTYNVFTGLKSFHVNEQTQNNFLNFQTVITNPMNLSFTSKNQLNNRYLRFDFVVIKSWSCTSPAVFAQSIASCVTICPTGYLANSYQQICILTNCSSSISNCLSCQYNSTYYSKL